MKIPEKIYRLRTEHDMTQLQFGQIAGASDKAVSTWEQGKKEPRMKSIQRICNHFDIPINIFVDEESDVYKKDDIPMHGSERLPARNLAPLPETYQVPRFGSIACGTPILAEQNIETYDSVPVSIRCDFTLICRGDSMIGAGIEDGDIVYIREQPEVETGEIAAVMVGEDEATLKRFKRIGDTVLLIPENSSYEPMVFSGGDMNGVRILGKAVGFTRHFRE